MASFWATDLQRCNFSFTFSPAAFALAFAFMAFAFMAVAFMALALLAFMGAVAVLAFFVASDGKELNGLGTGPPPPSS
jgi:hypothetical protein